MIGRSDRGFQCLMISKNNLPQSALFNFHSFLTVVLLVICTCTFVKMQFPTFLEHRTGYLLPAAYFFGFSLSFVLIPALHYFSRKVLADGSTKRDVIILGKRPVVSFNEIFSREKIADISFWF